MTLTLLLFQEELANHKQRIGQALEDAGGALKGSSVGTGDSCGCSLWMTIPAVFAYIALVAMTATGIVLLHIYNNIMNLQTCHAIDINFFISCELILQSSVMILDMGRNINS